MIRLFHTKIGFYRIYPSGFYVDPKCRRMDIVLLLFSISAQNKSEDVFYLILTDEASYFFCINPLNAVG